MMKPGPMSADRLVAVLEDMLAKVKAGQSSEGSIKYFPGGDDAADFMVEFYYFDTEAKPGDLLPGLVIDHEDGLFRVFGSTSGFTRIAR